jgi:hypothetical protein
VNNKHIECRQEQPRCTGSGRATHPDRHSRRKRAIGVAIVGGSYHDYLHASVV